MCNSKSLKMKKGSNGEKPTLQRFFKNPLQTIKLATSKSKKNDRNVAITTLNEPKDVKNDKKDVDVNKNTVENKNEIKAKSIIVTNADKEYNAKKKSEIKNDMKIDNKENDLINNFDDLSLNDELKHFTFKVINEDTKPRHESYDSGYSDKINDETLEKDAFQRYSVKDEVTVEIQKDVFDVKVIDSKNDKTDELTKGLEDLKINKGNESKEKKFKRVFVSRAPIRHRDDVKHYPAVYPYQQVHQQVNRQTLSGSQVYVSKDSEFDFTPADIDIQLPTITDNLEDYFILANEYVEEKTKGESYDDVLAGFTGLAATETEISMPKVFEESTIDPIEEFEKSVFESYYKEPSSNDILEGLNELLPMLTPPRSNDVSPVSSPISNNTTMMSPNLSRGDEYEKYQDMSDLPIMVDEFFDEKQPKNMTMKMFKDMQVELVQKFSKMDCCRAKKPSKFVLKEYFSKLNDEEKKNLCLRVAGLKLDEAYGVLHHIINSLSSTSEQEVVQYALFGLICERILAEEPMLFVGSMGLNLLSAATLRCYNRPILTRYLVECIRKVLQTPSAMEIVKGSTVFNEVDVNGDNLISACAALGDQCAMVMSELLQSNNEMPLFDVHHFNAEGFSPLHIACMKHGDSIQALHSIHVLLTHGKADIWKGDVKGGDTAVHHAVRSSYCDLNLVMLLFKQVDRKMWKQLSHVQNRSSTTPLELARIATKSMSRKSYPTEVLNFLKKCR